MKPEPLKSPRPWPIQTAPTTTRIRRDDPAGAHRHLLDGILARWTNRRPNRRPEPGAAGRLSVTPKAARLLEGDPGATEDEKLLERGPSAAFLETDPWRALRILSEFVEGFDAMAGSARR